jgi:AAA ATPase domain
LEGGPVTTQLGDLLDEARRRTFVGRRHELASFDDALAGRSRRRVLLVHGPGGIGKTTLLLELRTRAGDAGRAAVLLDGREIDPSPEGFEHAVLIGLGERTAAGPLSDLLAGAVLLVDAYEQLGPIDGWLRQAFLPALPADGLVVLAGRDAPAAAWRTDPGWRSVVAVHRLDHFDEAESDELLARAGVAPSVRAHLVRLGRGHPLAMALLADVAGNGTVPDSLAEVPDLVSALLETLLRGAPSDAHMSGQGGP